MQNVFPYNIKKHVQKTPRSKQAAPINCSKTYFQIIIGGYGLPRPQYLKKDEVA